MNCYLGMEVLEDEGCDVSCEVETGGGGGGGVKGGKGVW